MKDKEMQIEEMANEPTKEEIEARNKIGKEKDELRQALLHYATAEASDGIKSLIDCEGCAFYLYENLGYRKITKDSILLSKTDFDLILPPNSVVLSKEEYNDYLNLKDLLDKGYFTSENRVVIHKTRKETAEKILFDLVGHTFECDGWTYTVDVDDVKWLADKYNVEIKE